MIKKEYPSLTKLKEEDSEEGYYMRQVVENKLCFSV